MSCWVSPEIAAEWWNISVDEVLQGAQSGTIPSKHDIGRLFIDVLPDSPQMVAVTADTEAEFGDWKIGRAETSQHRRKLAA